MVDHAHQGKGYGKQMMMKLLEEFFSDPAIELVELSMIRDPGRAEGFCKHCGFEATEFWQLLLPPLSPLFRILPQLPSRFPEGVVDGKVGILVLLAGLEVPEPFAGVDRGWIPVEGGFVIDHEFHTRNPELDSNVKGILVTVTLLGKFHHDPATRDPVEEPLQFFRFLTDSIFQPWGGVEVFYRNLERNGHAKTSYPARKAKSAGPAMPMLSKAVHFLPRSRY